MHGIFLLTVLPLNAGVLVEIVRCLSAGPAVSMVPGALLMLNDAGCSARADTTLAKLTFRAACCGTAFDDSSIGCLLFECALITELANTALRSPFSCDLGAILGALTQGLSVFSIAAFRTEFFRSRISALLTSVLEGAPADLTVLEATIMLIEQFKIVRGFVKI